MRNLNKKIFFDENAPPTLFESIDIETQRELFKREHLGIWLWWEEESQNNDPELWISHNYSQK